MIYIHRHVGQIRTKAAVPYVQADAHVALSTVTALNICFLVYCSSDYD